MVRRLLPAVVGIPAFVGWAGIKGQAAGLYGEELGITLFATTNIVCFAWVVGWNGRALLKAEEARRAAELAITRSETALAQSQARLKALDDAGLIGIVVSRLDGRILEINAALLSTLGYEREEILSGKVPWSSLTPAEWTEADDRAVTDLRSRGYISLRQKEYLHKSGTRVPVMVGSTLLAGSSDEAISFVLDLTHHKEAALAVEKLRAVGASEAKFRGLLEAAPDAMVIVDSSGRIALVNGQAERLFGYGRRQLLGRAPEILLPERLRVEYLRERTAFFAGQQTRLTQAAPIELVGLRQDGSEFPIEASVSPLDTHEGRFISSAIRDITQRRRAEAQRASLAAIVDSSADGIIGKTLDGVITSWNQGATHIFGYAPHEMIGKPVSLLIPEARHAEEVEFLRLLAGGQRIEQFETTRKRKDGREIHVSLTLSPVFDASGHVIGASKIVRDMTERRQAELALAAAKEAAEMASRELEAFSYSVAHDLRAPLRGMNGFAQILLNGYGDKLDTEGRDFLQEIVQNARKMGELIDGLLSLARTTRSGLIRQHLDLSALAQEINGSLQSASPERKVELSVTPGLSAEADPPLVRALLSNLLGNAWKFSEQRKPARVEFGATTKLGERAFFVRDNGAGFDMAYADKLFAPFQRLHAASEFPGTGIGLATAQRIVQRHGGRIWAEGSVDVGATFHFTLPPPAEEGA